MELTNADVADILALLDSLPYDQLDLRTDRFRLTLRRTTAGTWTEERQTLAEPVPVLPAASATSATHATDGADGADVTSTASGAASAAATADADGLVAVLAPLPGTFYRAPRPGAAPFVEIGDAVTADTIVAIVETMKLMNPVAAGTPGRIARIGLANGDFAALGSTVIWIEPAA